ncbi:trypsin-like serine peptidase [Wenjunlia tyrosinilytica]|nr:trypsin-like peptidase domain-containing protein [Wenjunlia tyrosinilytica]
MGTILSATRAVLLATTVGSALLSAAIPTGAQPAEPAAGVVRHSAEESESAQRRAHAYWTPERMRAARPVEEYTAAGRAAAPPPHADGKPWPGGKQAVRTTGQLFLVVSGGRPASCTAAVVESGSEDVVATAAHCVHLAESGGWSERMVFVPGYEGGRAPYGEFPARRAAVSAAWMEDEDPDEDYAFVRLAASDRGHVADVVGARPASFTPSPHRETVVLGYPADPPFDGESVQYCSGAALASPYVNNPRQHYVKPCYFTPGASGGPWYTGFDAATGKGVQTGVTSAKPVGPGGDAYVFGAMFDAMAERLLHAADSP